MKKKTAVIIGAGPAGLTAALELLEKTDIKPVIYEETRDIGGISKTVNYKGNRIDIGGHRFFSKSERVMDWWNAILPLQGETAKDYKKLGRTVTLSEKPDAPDPEKTDLVMLVRNRLSRIFYLRSFFDYPVALNGTTIKNLGLLRIVRIGISYLWIRLFPIRGEESLEDFYINRFGRELYNTFFKDYTEKVWGVPPAKIGKDWGAQRVKGLSLIKTLLFAVSSLFRKKEKSISQKNVETSLIEQFLYPKFGPGHLWQEVARRVVEKGGEIHLGQKVVGISFEGVEVRSVRLQDAASGKETDVGGDYFFSTMPVKDLVAAMGPKVPAPVQEVAKGLVYRDFMTVGLLLNKLKIKNSTRIPTLNHIVPDTWIYIQERDVKVGRLQIFNNWSPYMVQDENHVWIGLEYFCDEGDEMWNSDDEVFKRFAISELEKIDIIEGKDVIDSTLIRVKKTYPAYFGTYGRFQEVRDYTDRFENLFLVGRNGMHRYNNMDHSMLTAMTAVDNIMRGIQTKDNIWAVNTEEEYHEEKK